MSQIADKGYSVKIKSKFYKLIDNESKQTVLVARRKGSLYVADWASATTEECIMVSQSGHTEEHWLCHKRMSHLNFKTLNKLAKKELVVGLPKTTFRKDGICSACQMGKQSKISFKSKPGILVLDLCNYYTWISLNHL